MRLRAEEWGERQTVGGGCCMDREELASVRVPDAPLFPPFPVLLTGMGVIAAAWLLGAALHGGAPVLRALLITTGVLAVGAAMAAQLPSAGSSLEGRLGGAGLWLLGAAVTVVARFALDPAWDSIALLFRVATLVTVIGAVVTALPNRWRKLAISLLIVFQLGGLATAVLNVPPPGGNPPWVVRQLWYRVYRPWLTLTNLNNGYHFYSPEPGPCALVWFRVEFADGATCWRRIPDHKTCQTHLQDAAGMAPWPRRWASAPTPPEVLEKLGERRLQAGMAHEPPIPPLPPTVMPLGTQYREPMLPGKMMLASYALVHDARRRPARKVRAGDRREDLPCRVSQPDGRGFPGGRDPLDPTLYSAFYEGEYDPEGNLKRSSLLIQRNAEGREIGRIQDPFLYWLIPIVRMPEQTEGEKEQDLDGAPVGESRSGAVEGRRQDHQLRVHPRRRQGSGESAGVPHHRSAAAAQTWAGPRGRLAGVLVHPGRSDRSGADPHLHRVRPGVDSRGVHSVLDVVVRP